MTKKLLNSFLLLISGVLLVSSLAANAEVFLYNGSDKQSLKSTFIYKVKPGEQVKDSLKIVNNDAKDVNLSLLASDLIANQDGIIAPTSGENKFLGSWISTGTQEVSISANSTVNVPFTISVPKDAKNGEYGASLVAKDILKKQAGSVTIKTNKSIKFYVLVGEENHTLNTEVKNLDIVDPRDNSFQEVKSKIPSLGKENMVVKFDAENTGDVFSRLEGEYTIKGEKWKEEKGVVSFDLVPGVGFRTLYISTNKPYQTKNTEFSFKYRIVPINPIDNLEKLNIEGDLTSSLTLNQNDLSKYGNSQFKPVQTEEERIADLNKKPIAKNSVGVIENIFRVLVTIILLFLTTLILVARYTKIRFGKIKPWQFFSKPKFKQNLEHSHRAKKIKVIVQDANKK